MEYYKDNHITVYNKDCRSMGEVADSSIQCVVTSPPYWGLRKYAGNPDLIWGGDEKCQHKWATYDATLLHENRQGLDGSSVGNTARRENKHGYKVGQAGFCSLCGAWRGAYGLEPTPELYVQHTIEILREIRRILRKDGVVFWNIGDSYAGSGKYPDPKYGAGRDNQPRGYRGDKVIKPKDLCLIPFRVAIAAQEDGWWVRSVIIWNKTNPMPESVKDRPTESHEYILMLTKSRKYYWDMEAVKEAYSPATFPRMLRGVGEHKYATHPEMAGGGAGNLIRPNIRQEYENWQYEGKAIKEYEDAGVQNPSDTKRRIIESIKKNQSGRNLRSVWTFPTHGYPEAHFAVFPEELPGRCIKAGSKEGDIILDPFAGSGTSLWVAKKLNRKAIGYELSREYCELIVERNSQQGLV